MPGSENPRSRGNRRRSRSRRRFRLGVVTSCTLLFVAIILGAAWGGIFRGAPPPPSKLAAEPISPTSVKLSWKGAEDIDKYVVRYGSDRSLSSSTDKITPATTNTTLQDLEATTPGAEHYFRVDAYRGDEVTSSRTGTFNLLPARIAKLKVAKKSTVGAKLTWAPVQNARQYDVMVAADKKFTKDVKAVRTVGGDNAFTTDELKPKTKYFIRIRPVNGSVLGTFTAPLALTTRATATEFSAATWNVCSEKCGGYAGRARIGAAFFNDNDIDIFGLQESGGKRVGRTTNAIWSGGKQGFVRATGGAEARYIFYRPALFTQVSGGYFGVGHGRHATWAHMRTKSSKRDFFFVDVHLENGHGNNGKRASEMRTLLGRMAGINDKRLPIIYVGDFNSGKHRGADAPGSIMRAAGMVDTVDASKSAPVNSRINTGHTFGTGVLSSGAHVDHIFASKDFDVLAWKQLARIAGGRYIKPMVSDHNALKATLSLDLPVADIGKPTPVTDVPSNEPDDTLTR